MFSLTYPFLMVLKCLTTVGNVGTDDALDKISGNLYLVKSL